MDLAKLSDRVERALDEALSGDLSAAEKEALQKIIRQALLDVSAETHEKCKEAAVFCCGPEADLAHKIQQRMDADRDMLIANLMAQR